MKGVKIIFYNLSILLFLFAILEIGFRLIHPDYAYYEQTYIGQFESSSAKEKLDTNWVDPDPDLGWVCKRKTNLNFYDSTYHHIQYGINPQGFRNPIDFDSLPSKKNKRILLLGDSFLFGIFLQKEATIRAQLQAKLGAGFEVITLAVPAWGLDQMYLSYQKYVDQINPDQVVIFLIDDDVSRTIEALYWGAATKPAFKLQSKRLQPRDSLEGLLNRFEAPFVFNSKIINQLYHHRCLNKAEPLASTFLKKWNQEEVNSGRQLKVIHFPRIEQVGAAVKLKYDFEDIFEKQNYLKVEQELLDIPKKERSLLYIPGDGHPSEKGAEFIAELILTLL